MFAQATLNDTQHSGDTIALSSLPSRAGRVHPSSEKSKSRGARRESTSQDRLHVCWHACTSPLPETSLLLSFGVATLHPPQLTFIHAIASHAMTPSQCACLAAQAGGRQDGLHIFANCGQSVKRIWSKDDDASLRRKSERLQPEPKCFKWITRVCHCDYTLLAGAAARWIVFYGVSLLSVLLQLMSLSLSLWVVASVKPLQFVSSQFHVNAICKHFITMTYFYFRISFWLVLHDCKSKTPSVYHPISKNLGEILIETECDDL